MSETMVMQDPGVMQQQPAMDDKVAANTFVNREEPDVPDARKKLVKRWCSRVRQAKAHWKDRFDRMKDNMQFCEGKQWPDPPKDQRDERYVANVCIRHVQQRTAELYPENPTMKAKKRQKLIAKVWDGSMMQLVQAQQANMLASQYGVMADPNSMMILQDAMMTAQWSNMMERVGKTLEFLYNYQIDEQNHPFKDCMKLTVRRTIVTGVGYVKLGFQRAMKLSPEIEQRISDYSERLANIERLSADLADDQLQPDSADAESLRIAIQTLMLEGQIITREGLAFDYPDSTAIIPDKKCKSLRGFLGSDWVAQEYLMTPDEVEEVYMVDVSKSFTVYDTNGKTTETNTSSTNHTYAGGKSASDEDVCDDVCCVWEIYNRKDGTMYVVCDGYPDFLQQPGLPDVEIDRFWPWFAFILNEGYNDKCPYPQSDIDLMRDMQLELNRARQGLREHRRANRPKTAVAAGVLEDDDLQKLKTHPANAVLELNALAPGQKIDDVLQPVKMPPIDPAMYDTAPVWEDVLRVLGSSDADMGGQKMGSSPTATEVSVSEFSQNTDTGSIIDDLNSLLTQLSRAASQVLILNVQQETVTKIVGPGAVWPMLDKQTVSENVWLEVDTGANGPPNRQEDMQMISQLVPLLQRVPGVNPEWLARELVRRMGDGIDLSEAFVAGLPSIEALNQLQGRPQPGPGQEPGQEGEGEEGQDGAGKGPPRPGQGDPNAQGGQGAQNAPASNPPGSVGPRPPPLQNFGANGMLPGGGPPPQGANMPTP